MRTTTYADVLEKASLLWTGNGEPSVDEAAELNLYINRRAREGWESAWWRELMVVECRQFRDSYDPSETYAASTATAAEEVYYAPTDKYYQCIKANGPGSPQAPADGSGDVNEDYWAECATSYSGEDWATATAYVVGDVVRNPVDGEYYHCHTAHTSSGTELEAAKFTILTPFVRSIDPDADTAIGEVKRVFEEDPALYPDAATIEAHWVNNELVVRGLQTMVWVEFRKRVPSWHGDAWDSGTTYAAGDQVYYAAEGDYFLSLAGSNTNYNPATQTAWWERIEFPWVLAEYVAQAAYADAARADNRPELFMQEQGEATRLLLLAISENDRRGGTQERLAVRTR